MDKKLGKGIVIVLIANIINLVFSLLTNFMLPKYLSVDSYANIKTFQLYIAYVGLLHLGYVDSIYLKYGGKELSSSNNKTFATTLSTMRVFQIFVTAIVALFALNSKNQILLFFALSILPLNMNNYFKFLYQATGEFTRYGRIMNITTMSTFIINMVLLFVFRIDQYLYYVVGYVGLYFTIWLALELNFKRKITIKTDTFFSLKCLRDNIKDGFLLTVGNLASVFLTSMDRWFVKILMTTLDFALYSFAVSVESFLNVAVTPITTTLYNFFCREKSTEKQAKIFDYVLIFAAILPCIAFPAKFILEIYLQKYIGSLTIIILLFAAQMFYIVIKSVFVNLYKVKRMQKTYFLKLLLILMVGFSFNVICYNIVHVKEAFSIGTLLSAMVWFVISSFDFKYLKIKVSRYIFLSTELVSFIFIGLTMESIIGLVTYLTVSALLLLLFMREPVSEAIGIGLSYIKRKG